MDKLALKSYFSNLLRHWLGNKCWDMNKRHLHLHRVRKKTLQKWGESYTCWHPSFFSVFLTSLLHLAESLNSIFQWIIHTELSKPVKEQHFVQDSGLRQGSCSHGPGRSPEKLPDCMLRMAASGNRYIINHKGPFFDNLEHRGIAQEVCKGTRHPRTAHQPCSHCLLHLCPASQKAQKENLSRNQYRYPQGNT